MRSLLSGKSHATFSSLLFGSARFSLMIAFLRMDYGLWTENSRGTYNKWDGVARSTIQVSLDVSVNVKLLCPYLIFFGLLMVQLEG